MAGAIRRMADRIIKQRGKGNETLELLTKAKITIKGVLVDKYDETSPDDPIVLRDLRQIAEDLGVKL